MGKQSRRWLRAQAQAAPRIVEVGAWLGRSTQVLAKHTPGKVWVVDHWQGTPDDPTQHELYAGAGEPDTLYSAFLANVAPYSKLGRVVPVRAGSLDAAAQFAAAGLRFDLIFIDADHRYEAVRADIDAYLPLLAKGGMFAGHDYKPGRWEGVVQAVDETFGSKVRLGPGTMWSVRP